MPAAWPFWDTGTVGFYPVSSFNKMYGEFKNPVKSESGIAQSHIDISCIHPCLDLGEPTI